MLVAPPAFKLSINFKALVILVAVAETLSVYQEPTVLLK